MKYVLLTLLLACGSSLSEPLDNASLQPRGSVTSYAIVRADGTPLALNAGDAVKVKVVALYASGVSEDLPFGTNVRWSVPRVAALSEDGEVELPPAFFLDNGARPEMFRDLADTLFVLEEGPLQIQATFDGGKASVKLLVGGMPDGDPDNGSMVYFANCAGCHGSAGYGVRAPGINALPGNAAAEWTPAQFAFSVLSGVNEHGESMREAMPAFLQTLQTQDLADMFAYLQTKKNGTIGVAADQLSGVAGDAIRIRAVIIDGASVQDVPRSFKVSYLQPTTFEAGSGALPDGGAFFVKNTERADLAADFNGRLFVRDGGPSGVIDIAIDVKGPISGAAQMQIPIGPALIGDAARGAELFVQGRCNVCHGSKGEGGKNPGLNAVNLDWPVEIFTFAVRSAIDDEGEAIAAPMPGFVSKKNAETFQPFSTQDFADIYAWLQQVSE